MLPSPQAARVVARVLRCGGLSATSSRDAGELTNAVAARRFGAALVGVDDLTTVAELLTASADTALFACCERPDAGLFRRASALESLRGLIGLRYPGSPPRQWELLLIARRLVSEIAPRQDGTPWLPPLQAPLSWGHCWREQQLAGTRDRDPVVAAVEQLCESLGSRRLAGPAGQLAHELAMNAIYDAPVDETGAPIYAHDRKRVVELAPHEQPLFGFGCDGLRLVVGVRDPFGGLERSAVFGGLYRALSSGQMDTSGGGAGLGMLLMYQAASLLFFDVLPGRVTQVTAVIELDVPPRERRELPRSVYYFSYSGGGVT